MNSFFKHVGCLAFLKRALLVSQLISLLADIVLIPSFYLTGMSKTVVIKCVVPIKCSDCGHANMEFSYLSPVVFTKILVPLMVETARQPGTDVRIINVS
jgi:hypothetical protein